MSYGFGCPFGFVNRKQGVLPPYPPKYKNKLVEVISPTACCALFSARTTPQPSQNLADRTFVEPWNLTSAAPDPGAWAEIPKLAAGETDTAHLSDPPVLQEALPAIAPQRRVLSAVPLAAEQADGRCVCVCARCSSHVFFSEAFFLLPDVSQKVTIIDRHCKAICVCLLVICWKPLYPKPPNPRAG